jgi:hypothetical protein
MTGQLAVGDYRLCHGAPDPSLVRAPLNSMAVAKIHFDRRRELSATVPVEAKFLFPLDLHDPRVLDHDLDRAKTHAADCAYDAPEDLVAVLELRLNFAAAV